MPLVSASLWLMGCEDACAAGNMVTYFRGARKGSLGFLRTLLIIASNWNWGSTEPAEYCCTRKRKSLSRTRTLAATVRERRSSKAPP
eukprot:5776720-Amphidinium_carterae.1